MTDSLSRVGHRSLLATYAAPAGALLAIALGAVQRASGTGDGQSIWLIGLILTGAPVVWRTVRFALRGHFATDVVATLAIATAVLLGHPLAGLVVTLMQTGGEALERYAEGRASLAVRELEAAAPRTAHVIDDGSTTDVAVDFVRIGTALRVLPGEIVPCDCVVLRGESEVDVSTLTGEPLPLSATPGTALLSGSINGNSALDVRTTALAAESQYARIVELVKSAQASKAPLQRLADRYAVWFTPATLLVCAIAYVASGDAVRVLAVLVVATPCPLILATPVAIVGGLNQAARRSVIVRNGTALERLAQCNVAVFDKTGTLTVGRPEVIRVEPVAGVSTEELLRLAAGVEQGSSHLLARTLVDFARHRGLRLPNGTAVLESPGRGVTGVVEGSDVLVGARSLAEERFPGSTTDSVPATEGAAGLVAYVLRDGRLIGVVEYADRVRPGVQNMLHALRQHGVTRTALLSGDAAANVAAIAQRLGISEAHGDLLPEEKVEFVSRLVRQGDRVLMVGDGTNDAPALSAATVGVALGGHGGGITTESADVVLLVDDVTRVADAVRVSARTLHIAHQSIWAGLGLSGVAMLFAAMGYIQPTFGALLQELIDVAVILNALRSSR